MMFITAWRHRAILKKGVVVWNDWREKNPDVVPWLRGANLNWEDLSGANLKNANLEKASLEKATLEDASLPMTAY